MISRSCCNASSALPVKEWRDHLHAFRQLYNDAKHDPDRPIRLKLAVDVVTRASEAVKMLITSGIGATAAPVANVVNRLLWVAGHDVYTGGVTEVYVSLPLPDEIFATHLDVVWIKGVAWDAMKAELLASGSFYYGKEHFSPEVYERFNEGDFIGAGVWDGDYRRLVSILSRHEDRPTADILIPSLRRDHMGIAVLSSIVLAGIDVAGSADAPVSAQEMAAAIIARADHAYAMPGVRPWVLNAASALATMVEQLPFATWRELSGPYWNLWNPKELTAKITSDDNFRYIIDDANRVVIV